MNEKPKILIADDSEINRALLKEILGDGYDYLEAEDGAAAVELMRQRTDISLLLLDLMMPGMDGFDVLRVMKYHAWLDEIPVIVISAAEDTANIERAYDLGVADYIRRPFERIMILRRVKNILMLYAKQKRLTRLVTDQVYEKEHNSVLMISILSHVVEFRNSESGLHVLHIRTLTDLLLHQLVQKTDRYQLDESDIALISTASALHDIGKIVIPEEILNKPGRLTAEEFAIIKNHTVAGAQMLQDLGQAIARDEPLLQVAHAICRWHHERWDGNGYPDRLKGDEIPIAAQVVALADVYDALTSERCYKHAYDHDTALRMILNGASAARSTRCCWAACKSPRSSCAPSWPDRSGTGAFGRRPTAFPRKFCTGRRCPGRTAPSCCWNRKRNARISTPPSAAASGSTTTCWPAA